MDRLIPLLACEWSIRWRSGVKPLLRGDTLAMTLILFSGALLKFNDHVHGLVQGHSRPAVMLLLTLLLGWVAWWGYDKGPAIPRAFPHFPLSRLDLLGLRLANGGASPLSWVLAVFTGATYPLFRRAGPGWLSCCAGFMLLCMSAGVLFSVAKDRAFADRRRALTFLVLVVLSLFVWPWNSCLGTFAKACSALLDRSATLTLGLFLGCASLFLLLAWALEAFPAPQKASGAAPPIVFPCADPVPGIRYRELLMKDLRILSKCLEPYLGLLIFLNYIYYIATVRFPHPLALLAACFMLCATYCPVVLNSFGLESKANILRYEILPLNGPQLLGSKNGAGVLAPGILLAPMVVLGGSRCGFLFSVLAILLSLNLILMFIIFGNATSIRFPERTRPYHFTSLSTRAGFARMVVVYFICYLPGVAMILVTRKDPFLALVVGLVGLFILAFYSRRRITSIGPFLEAQIRQGMQYPKG